MPFVIFQGLSVHGEGGSEDRCQYVSVLHQKPERLSLIHICLGLAIAKNIVDMHGGTIGVTSDLNGTVFTVRLQVNFDINKENFGKLG